MKTDDIILDDGAGGFLLLMLHIAKEVDVIEPSLSCKPSVDHIESLHPKKMTIPHADPFSLITGRAISTALHDIGADLDDSLDS